MNAQEATRRRHVEFFESGHSIKQGHLRQLFRTQKALALERRKISMYVWLRTKASAGGRGDLENPLFMAVGHLGATVP